MRFAMRDMKVPKENILGPPGKGLKVAPPYSISAALHLARVAPARRWICSRNRGLESMGFGDPTWARQRRIASSKEHPGRTFPAPIMPPNSRLSRRTRRQRRQIYSEGGGFSAREGVTKHPCII